MAALPSDTVLLVPSRRGKEKALYDGRTFTLDQRSGARYRWRCDVRLCKSRLTTDLYDGRHMVYRFRPHDEEPHTSVVKEKQQRRVLTRFKQPRVEIGKYNYILESIVDGVAFWRCAFVSCSGRCRTRDVNLVAGPSKHSCDDLQQPPRANDEPENQVQDVKHETSENEASFLEPSIVIEEAGRVQKNPAIFEEGTTSADSSDHGTGGLGAFKIKAEPQSPIPDVEPEGLDRSIAVENEDTSHEQVDIGPETGDMEVQQGDNLDLGLADDAWSSDMDANDSQDHLPRISSYGTVLNGLPGLGDMNVGQVLAATPGVMDPREKELRRNVLLQMHRLLKAETDLMIQKRENEVLRNQILRRQLQSMVDRDSRSSVHPE